MKKFSSFQVILLVVFGALAVGGVLIFAVATSTNNSKSLGPIKIWGTLDEPTFSAALRNMAQNDSNLSQTTYIPKVESTYQTDLTKAFASGIGPDLFIVRQDYAYEDSGEIQAIPFTSLSQSQFQNTFVDAANPFLMPAKITGADTSQTGGIIALPILVDPLVLYWNKDMLAGAGIAQPPQYWDQILGMALAITKKDETGKITQSAIAFGQYDNIANAKDVMSLLILQTGATLTAYDDNGLLVSSIGTADNSKNIESALRFYTEFSDPSKDDYSWNRSFPDAQKAFADGNLALYIGYASELTSIRHANPNLNFGLTTVPQIRGSNSKVGYARVYGLAASRTGKNVTGAVTAAYLLASADNAKQLATAFSLPSARRDLLSTPAQDQQDLFNKQAILAHTWVDPSPEKTSDMFRAMIEDTTSGVVLIPDAVSRIIQQMSALLQPL